MFDIAEIEVLIDALTTWESAPIQGAMMTTMLGAMLIKDQDEAKRITEQDMAKAEATKAQRSEASTMLKAKLLGMKREVEANATLANAFQTRE